MEHKSKPPKNFTRFFALFCRQNSLMFFRRTLVVFENNENIEILSNHPNKINYKNETFNQLLFIKLFIL